MAQLAEQLTCNQQVIGSSPIIGLQLNMVVYFGWVPEWPKGADCKSVIDDFEGSNPSPSIGVEPKIVSVKPWTIYQISRGGAVWKLVGLITRRS